MNRIFSLDALRAAAIISIVLAHIHYFIPNDFWTATQTTFMLIGLGLFTFISGLSIDLNNSEKVSDRSEIMSFYRKRATRLLPLDWFSIALSVLLTLTFIPLFYPAFAHYPQSNLNPSILFAQSIGSDLLFQKSVSYNWFVSLIIICNLFYPFIIKLSRNVSEQILLASGPFILFIFLRVFFGLVDDRLFIFYLIFVSGMLVNKLLVNWKIFSYKIILAAFSISLISGFLYYWRGGTTVQQIFPFNNPSFNFVFYQIFVLDIAIISSCIFLIQILNINRLTCALQKLTPIIAFFAISSYVIYLFHFPFFTIGQGLIEYLKLSQTISSILFYAGVIPLTFISSYFIAKWEANLRNKMISQDSCKQS